MALEWLNPNNWSNETKAAAEKAVIAAALLVVSIITSNSKAGERVIDAATKSLPVGK